MKIPKDNQFTYKISDGIIKGYFNIYQGKSGKIYLNMGELVTALSKKQIQELHVDCYSLIDFDYDLYMKAY
jgi:hypothetical protein